MQLTPDAWRLSGMTRHFADWIMKVVLLCYIVARLISGPPAEQPPPYNSAQPTDTLS